MDHELLRDANDVVRYHTVGFIRNKETVGHHCANVASLAIAMWRTVEGEWPPASVLGIILTHDVHELETGDLPAPIKRNMGLATELAHLENQFHIEHDIPTMTSALTVPQIHIVQFLDSFDCVMFCLREIQRGNGMAHEMFHRAWQYAREKLDRINSPNWFAVGEDWLNQAWSGFNDA